LRQPRKIMFGQAFLGPVTESAILPLIMAAKGCVGQGGVRH
jgi:hypothetical protein